MKFGLINCFTLAIRLVRFVIFRIKYENSQKKKFSWGGEKLSS